MINRLGPQGKAIILILWVVAAIISLATTTSYHSPYIRVGAGGKGGKLRVPGERGFSHKCVASKKASRLRGGSSPLGGDGSRHGYDKASSGKGRKKPTEEETQHMGRLPKLDLPGNFNDEEDFEPEMYNDPSDSEQDAVEGQGGEGRERGDEANRFNVARDGSVEDYESDPGRAAEYQTELFQDEPKQAKPPPPPTRRERRFLPVDEPSMDDMHDELKSKVEQGYEFKKLIYSEEDDDDTDAQWIRRLNLTDVVDLADVPLNRSYDKGIVTTIAGQHQTDGYRDGVGTQALFNNPYSIAFNKKTAELYVSETDNNCIRKLKLIPEIGGHEYGRHEAVAAAGGGGGKHVEELQSSTRRTQYAAEVTTVVRPLVARRGYRPLQDGPVSQALFACCFTLGFHPITDELLILDSPNHRVRALSPSGQVRTYAGGDVGYDEQKIGYEDGPASEARFYYPFGMAIGPSGSVYISQPYHSIIRKISYPQMEVTTVAGVLNTQGNHDGPRLNATIAGPRSMASDNNENIFFIDYKNMVIRKIDRENVTTVSGAPERGFFGGMDGHPDETTFVYPEGISVDDNGNILVADTVSMRVRMLEKGTYESHPIAGRVLDDSHRPKPPPGKILDDTKPDGPASKAFFESPWSICPGAQGDLFVVDKYGSTIRRIDSYLPPKDDPK